MINPEKKIHHSPDFKTSLVLKSGVRDSLQIIPTFSTLKIYATTHFNTLILRPVSRWYQIIIKKYKFITRKKPTILICTSRWFRHTIDSRVSLIPYPHISYLVDSLNSTKFGTPETFCFDDLSKSLPNIELEFSQSFIKKIKDINPNLILIESWELGFIGNKNRSTIDLNNLKDYIDFLTKIKNSFKIPIAIYWSDIQELDCSMIAKNLEDYIDFHNVWDISNENSMKYLYTPAPINSFIYKQGENKKKSFDVSFVGTIEGYPEREQILSSIKKLNFKCNFLTDGIFKNNSFYVTDEQCAEIYNSSKIIINFCNNRQGKPQVKGRVFESILCGALLLEQENNQTSEYFIPYKEYVPWVNYEDLVEKIKYFLSHENERAEIALKGSHKAKESYSSEKYWAKILSRAKLKIPKN